MTDNKVYFLNRNPEILKEGIMTYTDCRNTSWDEKLNRLIGSGTVNDVLASAYGTKEGTGIKLRLDNYKTQKSEVIVLSWSDDTAVYIGDFYTSLQLKDWNGRSQYTIDDLEILERSWAAAVDNKKYRRLDYNTWKKIFRNEDRPIESVKAILYFLPQNDSIAFELYKKKNNKFLYSQIFSYSSKISFGYYLYKHYFENEQWMMELMNNYNTTGVETWEPNYQHKPVMSYSSDCNDVSALGTCSTAVTWDNARSTSNINWYDSTTGTGNSSIYLNSDEIYYGTDTNKSNLSDEITGLKHSVDKLKKAMADCGYCEKPKNNTKENTTMTITNSNSLSKSLNLDIGTCEKDNVKMSPYGLAVKNAQGVWVSYDAKTGSIMDVEILNFDCGKFLYKIPVALDQIKAGDVIIHNRVPMFVKAVKEGAVEAVDIVSGSVQVVLPVKNMFNFNFVTKIISLVDFSNAGATKDNPFGNLVPFMLLAEGNSNGNDLLPLLLMNGGMNGFDMSNPLALYALCGSGSKASDILPVMLLSQAFNGAPKANPAN